MDRSSAVSAFLVLVVVSAALLAACGDDTPSPVPVRSDTGSPDDTTAGDADTAGGDDAPTVDATPDGSGDGTGDASDAVEFDAPPLPVCVDGAVRPCFSADESLLGIGVCAVGSQVCEDEEWGECEGDSAPGDEICDGLDNDCDRETDEGVSNDCGLCGAAPLEICGDGFDNDCNGVIDDAAEGCACGGRLDQPCYSGPPHTLGIGPCGGGTFDCIEGAWGPCEGEVVPEIEVCDGVDNDCDGDIDEGTRNACGECGDAVPEEVCDGVDNDCDGSVDEGVRRLCGLCEDEIGEEECGDGFDNDCDGNVDEACPCSEGLELCYPGPPEAMGVGECFVGSRGCDATGEFWEACEGFVLPSVEVCDGLDNDCDGSVDVRPNGCSVCGASAEECDGLDNDCDGQIDEGLLNECGECLADVTPEETLGSEFCDGLDNDCDGLIDEGLLNECGTCDDESCSECEFFVPGWSEEERCGDGQDNDGDGEADEGCPCDFGTTQPCFLGAPNSRRIGACLDGSQTCVDRGAPHWGACEGGILPSEEVCDGKDNDCNGCVDDGDACDILLSCPVEDFAVPLRNYALLGDSIYVGEADAWHWTVEPPAGSATAGPEDADAMNTSFFVDVSGDYLVTVEITIGDTVRVCTWILHAVGTGLRVELIWDNFGSVDLDLHLHRPGSTADWCDMEDDCFYANCDDGDSPPWDYPDSTEGCPVREATCHNPRLDIDNIRGRDPENINIDNPNEGDSFRIMVHEYSKAFGVGATRPELRIYCGGFLAAELGVPPDTVSLRNGEPSCLGDTWRVADVEMHVDPETGGATCDISVLSGSGSGGWDVREDDRSY